jgi:Domain of unknown function (DUF4169)
MADIINLRRARKAKARDEESQQADFNRHKFGQSKSDKQLTKAKLDQAKGHLDGHKRDPV